jgi:hypothetical protein
MAIQSITELFVPPLPDNIVTSPSYAASATFDITALGGYGAYVGQMPYTATLDTVFFRVGSIGAGNSFTARVAIERVSLASGFPTLGVLYPNASASILVTAAGDYAARFPAPITVQRGELFSIVIAAIAGSPNTCRFAEFADDNPSIGFPYMVDAAAGSPAYADNVAPGIGLALSGVSAIPLPHCWPMTSTTQHAFTAPASHGNKITIRSTVRASGAVVWGDSAVAAPTINLYSTDGATILASTSAWGPFTPPTATIQYRSEFLFSQPAILTPGTYYLAVSGGPSGSTTATMHYANFNQNIWREASPMGGASVMYVSANTVPTGTTSWTEVSTRQMFMGLIVDGIDDGVKETSSVFAT